MSSSRINAGRGVGGASSTRARRSLIFLAVVLCHCLMLVALLRTAWSPPDRRRLADGPLVLLLLPRSSVSANHAPSLRLRESAPRAAAHSPLPNPPSHALPNDDSPDLAAQPMPPSIDWEREAALEVQRERSDGERDRAYRNLAGLTPERRAWLESHHMEPAPEGIHWAHPRVEIVNGLPIIWVNDHCVALPLMMLLVFCSIGHIEPRGDLLDHMREADEARARSLVP